MNNRTAQAAASAPQPPAGLTPADFNPYTGTFTCTYCGEDTTECRIASTLGPFGAPCGA